MASLHFPLPARIHLHLLLKLTNAPDKRRDKATKSVRSARQACNFLYLSEHKKRNIKRICLAAACALVSRVRAGHETTCAYSHDHNIIRGQSIIYGFLTCGPMNNKKRLSSIFHTAIKQGELQIACKFMIELAIRLE